MIFEMMLTKVYVAGSSREIDRARRVCAALRDIDVHVMSTWPEVIGKVGAANPHDATPDQLLKWTLRDLGEVGSSDILLLLLPEEQTIGAWIELGFAFALAQNCSALKIVMSGRHRPIFTEPLADVAFPLSGDDLRLLPELVTARLIELDNMAIDWIKNYQRDRVEHVVGRRIADR